MKLKNLSLMLLGLMTLLFGLIACSNTAEQGSNFPAGKFVLPDNKHVGFDFNSDGTWVAFDFGDAVAKGTYQVKGDIFTEEAGPDACADAATYRYSFDGTYLRFDLVGEDSCEGRRGSHDGITYIVADKFASIPKITIDAKDFSYDSPDIIPAGWVRIVLNNSGQEPHHVQFFRLNDGITVEQFQDALKQGEGPAMAMVQQRGGVGAVAPNGSAQSVLNLTEGNYVILCFVPSPDDHLPHLAKGMVKAITVQPSGEAVPPEPNASITIIMQDFIYEMPDTFSSGLTTVKVINNGPEPHELNILRLADGKTIEDVTSYLEAPEGPPPFIPVGGMNGLDAGLDGYMELNLKPGSYVAICNIPSPKAEGRPHFDLGMIREFEVN